MRKVPLFAPSGDSKRELREWIQALAAVGMLAWWVSSVLWTFGFSILGVNADSLNCYSAVLCREASVWGGHTWVWIIVWGFGLVQGFLNHNFVFGLVQALFWGSLHEVAWNILAVTVYGSRYFLALTWTIEAFIVGTFVIVGVCLTSSKLRGSLDLRKFVLLLPLWCIFMGLWFSIGFPVTLYQGMTAWFLNPQTNLIEICSFLLFFSAAFGVVKFPERVKP